MPRQSGVIIVTISASFQADQVKKGTVKSFTTGISVRRNGSMFYINSVNSKALPRVEDMLYVKYLSEISGKAKIFVDSTAH